MTKVTELTIHAQAAVKYPGWRVDFAGPDTVVMTHIMGRRRVIEVRRRRERCDGPVVRIAKWLLRWIRIRANQAMGSIKWIGISVVWLFGLWMACMGIVALALL